MNNKEVIETLIVKCEKRFEMSDITKVIEGLKCCNSETMCDKCPYSINRECEAGGYYYSKAIEKAIALLQKQKPASPVLDYWRPDGGSHFKCGNCGCGIGYAHESRFCKRCGKAVKWK